MAGFDDSQALLHNIQVKLYPNYLTETGKYIARTVTEHSVTIEEICANLRERGGFRGNTEEVIYNVRQFLKECIFLVCDGWPINLDYYTIHARVSGAWDSPDEVRDREKHPVSFTFSSLKPLREAAGRITIEVIGIEETSAYLDTVEDASTGAINETVTSASEIIIRGHRIKVEGTDPNCGLFLVTQPGGAEHRITRRLAVNGPSEIITVVPDLPADSKVKVRIVTQYSSGKTLLKEPRVVELSDILTVINPAPGP
jgi:hypothetical protein